MTFNLIDEAWVLVQTSEGQREVSLRQAFAESDQIVQLTGEVPTQAFALLRLMLAICHDAIGWHGDRDMRELHRKGLSLKAIDDYLTKYHDRFELFDDKRPFMQVADLRTAKGEHSGLEKIIADVPNGVPFFTTRAGVALEQISAAEAARWLVHVHAFDPSGIRSGAVGDDLAKNGKGYPTGPGWAGQIGGVVIHGSSLRETLVSNIVSTKDNPADRPCWAWDTPQSEVRSEDAIPEGPVQTLVWQSRRVRLVGGVDGVVGVVLCQGDKLAPQRMRGTEPMTAWRYSKPQSAKFGMPIYMPKELEAGRAMWRGLPALVSSAATVVRVEDKGSKFEATVLPETLAALDEESPMVVVQTIGMQYGAQNAVTEEIIDDRLEISASLLSDDGASAQRALSDGVHDAEEAVRAIGQLAANLARAAGEKGDGAGDGARQRAMEEAWTLVDGPARAWVRTLSAETDADEARARWRAQVVAILRGLADRLVDQASPAAITGRETSFGYMSAHKAYAGFLNTLRKQLSIPQHETERTSDE